MHYVISVTGKSLSCGIHVCSLRFIHSVLSVFWSKFGFCLIKFDHINNCRAGWHEETAIKLHTWELAGNPLYHSTNALAEYTPGKSYEVVSTYKYSVPSF